MLTVTYRLWQRCWTTEYEASGAGLPEILAQVKATMNEEGEHNPTVFQVVKDGRRLDRDHLEREILGLAQAPDPEMAAQVIRDYAIILEVQRYLDDQVYA